MLKSLKQQQVKEAYEREQKAELALVESGEKLQEKLRSFGYPSNVSGRAPEPCENFRNAIATCYRVNGKDNPLACAGEVEAFTECAKQLSKVSS